jgi:signal transduction histidine kinase
LPLVAEENAIGILVLATDSPDQFTSEREAVAVEVGSQLAVALQQARLFAQVSAGREQLRALSFRLVEVQEAERRFIASELHDEIGQALTGLKLSLEMTQSQTRPRHEAGLSETLTMLDELTQRVRQLSLDLRPPVLDDLGLLPALDWLIQRFCKQTSIRVDLRHTTFEKRLPASLEAAAFRIVQEALTNVARHASVKEATVRLWSDKEFLGVQIEDKGAGFDFEKVRASRVSCGLSGMRERAVLLGGRFTLDSASGSGTRVTVELPLRPRVR